MAKFDVFVPAGARVRIPDGLYPPFTVFVNGIEQTEGEDFRIDGRFLMFRETLVREGRLGFWRWFWMLLGVANTYRHNDGVDISARIEGKPYVFTALPIETLKEYDFSGGRRGAVSFDPSGR